MKKLLLTTAALAAICFSFSGFTTTEKPYTILKEHTSEEVLYQKAKNITGSDLNTTVAMDGGTLVVTGSDNSITVTGFASKIIVTGSGNSITADVLNSATIVGSTNQIIYRSSKNKNKRASLISTGSENMLSKR